MIMYGVSIPINAETLSEFITFYMILVSTQLHTKAFSCQDMLTFLFFFFFLFVKLSKHLSGIPLTQA